MTVIRCKRIALLLANAHWVRYWVCLNYPNKPDAVCIQIRNIHGGVLQFDGFAEQEMVKAGFEFKVRFGIYGYHADVTDEPTEPTAGDAQ